MAQTPIQLSSTRIWLSGAMLLTAPQLLMAQMTLTGQLRTRTEIRNGLGNLAPINAPAAVFTSQRTRLTFGYKWDRVQFGAAIQDVRVWGQDASTISNTDGNKLMVHEAWADILLANRADSTVRFRAIENLSLKIGRQELNYDDVRLLGNLDWLQQARRFDAALLKAQHKGWLVDLGVGFNQNTDAFGVVGTNYVPGNVPTTALSTKGELLPLPGGFVPTAGRGGAPVLLNPVGTNGQNQQFKSFQMAYVSRQVKKTKLSALFFKDDFAKYRLDSTGTATAGYVYGRRYDQTGTHSRLTYGAMLTGQFGATPTLGLLNWQAFAYWQNGTDRDGFAINNAQHYGLHTTYVRGKFSTGLGYEVLSGDATNPAQTRRTSRFDPLYGTPHKHWGYMDYFYVGTGAPMGGLQDAFWKAKYTGARLTAGLDIHYFALATAMANPTPDVPRAALGGTRLGLEFDFTATYALNKITTVELGYAVMSGTNTLEFAKNGTVDQRDKTGTWAYLMLNIRPDFLAVKK